MSAPDSGVLLEGQAPYAQHALEMVAGARQDLSLLTQALEPRTWCTEAFVDAVRTFVLQHERTRFRILVANARQAISGGSRLVELGRALSSFIEFRELMPERRPGVIEEYLIADGRLLLHRETPSDLESRFFGSEPRSARTKLRSFDLLWNESTTAQELRDLKL